MKPRVYRSRLSFTKAELDGHVDIRFGGISLHRNALVNFDVAKEFVPKHLQADFDLLGGGNGTAAYYDSNIADIKPKAEDYYKHPFRLLSATKVGAYTWKATDFSNAEMLRASTDMLLGLGVHKEHNRSINSVAGYVSNVSWGEGFVQDDVNVPPGIEGVLALDMKTNPTLVRNIISGGVYSNSVTVDFDWVPSHTLNSKEADYFESMVGDIAPDGKMYCRVATKINAYHETSLCWLGADPFAKSITDDGKLRHIDVGSISYSKTEAFKLADEAEPDREKYQKTHSYSISFGLADDQQRALLDRSKKRQQQQQILNNNENNTKMNKEFLAAFLVAFGSQLGLAADATVESLSAELVPKIQALKLMTTEQQQNLANFDKMYAAALAFLKTEDAKATTVDLDAFNTTHSYISNTELTRLQALDTANAELTNQVTTLTPKAALGDSYIALQKAELVRLYKQDKGDKADPALIARYESANASDVQMFLKQYVDTTTSFFKGHCAKCDSTEFTFRSALTPDDSENTSTVKPGETSVKGTFTAEDFRSAYGQHSEDIRVK